MIKIKFNDSWEEADEQYIDMFNKYRRQNRYSELPYTENDITIGRINNDAHNGIYIHIGNHKYPICDWDDVKIFLTDLDDVRWYPARNYQTWAFFDFIYDNKNSKNYVSYGSTIIPGDIVIDIPGLPADIIFKIKRNSNYSISFQRNDLYYSQFRISDNEWARTGYRGFYTRMTMDPGMIILPPIEIQSNKLELPNDLILTQTNDENDQCIMCVNYKINIRFEPCNHSVSCSECYKKMEYNLCPICKKNINKIIKNT